jgi:Tfp pilus assembly PilM family ATPase
MLIFPSNRAYPIGVDITDDGLRMAQVREGEGSLLLLRSSSKSCPPDILPGTATWQRWAIEAIRSINSENKFVGKYIVASIPPSDVFIDNIKVPRNDSRDFEEAVMQKTKQKLTGEFENALVKHVAAEEDNVVIIASSRLMIDRHLAIYENSGMKIKSIGIWPLALINTYVRLFGRRATDRQAVVMLIDVGILRTNVVICRHMDLLFARSIPVGIRLVKTGDLINRLITEISASKQNFGNLYKKAKIERVVFMSGQAVDKEVYVTIAKQLQMPAQIGDCLSAILTSQDAMKELDRRNSQFSWATAFGLSLLQ